MEALFADINWLAVIVGAIAAFLVGWLWYSPVLFQKKWLTGIGISLDDQTPMAAAMGAQIFSTFLLAVVIGITMATASLGLAILIALTIAGIVKANGLYTQKSTYAIMVETGYILVMVAIMILTHIIF